MSLKVLNWTVKLQKRWLLSLCSVVLCSGLFLFEPLASCWHERRNKASLKLCHTNNISFSSIKGTFKSSPETNETWNFFDIVEIIKRSTTLNTWLWIFPALNVFVSVLWVEDVQQKQSRLQSHVRGCRLLSTRRCDKDISACIPLSSLIDSSGRLAAATNNL